MPISKRKLAANRANAKKSTGPKSEAGKEAVSQNHSIHGLCGRFRVLSVEDQDQYDSLLQGFLDAEKPIDAVERELVIKMARHTWLSARALRFQEACFIVHPASKDQQSRNADPIGLLKEVHVYERYQANHDRAYQKAAKELATRRKDRQLAARGFESQKRAAAESRRREQLQNQRTELHHYKIATAKARFEQRFGTPAKAAAAGKAAPSPGNAPLQGGNRHENRRLAPHLHHKPRSAKPDTGKLRPFSPCNLQQTAEQPPIVRRRAFNFISGR